MWVYTYTYIQRKRAGKRERVGWVYAGSFKVSIGTKFVLVKVCARLGERERDRERERAMCRVLTFKDPTCRNS